MDYVADILLLVPEDERVFRHASAALLLEGTGCIAVCSRFPFSTRLEVSWNESWLAETHWSWYHRDAMLSSSAMLSSKGKARQGHQKYTTAAHTGVLHMRPPAGPHPGSVSVKHWALGKSA